jgi:hypothetical protein
MNQEKIQYTTEEDILSLITYYKYECNAIYTHLTSEDMDILEASAKLFTYIEDYRHSIPQMMYQLDIYRGNMGNKLVDALFQTKDTKQTKQQKTEILKNHAQHMINLMGGSLVNNQYNSQIKSLLHKLMENPELYIMKKPSIKTNKSDIENHVKSINAPHELKRKFLASIK